MVIAIEWIPVDAYNFDPSNDVSGVSEYEFESLTKMRRLIFRYGAQNWQLLRPSSRLLASRCSWPQVVDVVVILQLEHA